MPFIEVNQLSFAFHETPVLEEISFSIEEGEFISIFGPNGGGKTTLLKILMGLYKPSRGKVSLPKCRVGWVPQTFDFDKQFPITVLEVVLGGRLFNTRWYGRYSAEDKKLARAALEQVGMLPFHHRPFAALSGGQAQRVLIARALASHPSILLLDEPTASTDPEAQKCIHDLLQSLKGKMTIVMVTHDLKSAIDLADRLYCIQKTLTQMSREQVCEHFALGLYHEPTS